MAKAAIGRNRCGHSVCRQNYIDTGEVECVEAAGCDQCQAAMINGVFCHETGCPNQTWECKGCNAPVKRAGAYCEDCQ